jgi:nitroreductase
MTKSAAEVNQLKHAPAVEGVLPVILQRWSPRSFSDREVSAKDLRTIFEAVRWAASSFNEQPWRFLLGRRGDPTYKKIFESLGEFNQAWAGSAPVLILGATRTKFSHNESDNRVALYDLGAAAATLCYQATHQGLFTHQMGGFDPGVARRLFAIPENFLLGAVIALGHQGDPAALAQEQLREQETAPRHRKPLSEIVLSSWDTPAHLD